MKTLNSFNGVRWYDFSRQRSMEIENEVKAQNKEYLLGVDEKEYIEYLINKYSLEKITINFESEKVGQPKHISSFREDRVYGRVQQEGYMFEVSYQFSGSPILFNVSPSTRTLVSYQIFVDESNYTVGFNLCVYEKNSETYEREKKRCCNDAFVNIDNINKEVLGWNSNLTAMVTEIFKNQKEKHESENKFFEAINIKINQDTKTIFTAPSIKKVIIPKPEVAKTKKYSDEPTMNPEMYDDVLRVIYEAGKGMEKKPSLYQGKDEEGLRDQFLFILETRYEGVTASGETFNKCGKTDILLKYSKDNSNLFVAECKFWNGESEYHNAIKQLFDRYLTWRDSKTALIIFAKNQGFSNVLKKIREETKKHNLYRKEIGNRGESSFSFEFCLPQDREKVVYLEVIIFHFDKQ